MLSSPNRRSRSRSRSASNGRRGLITTVFAAATIVAGGAMVACSDTPVEPVPVEIAARVPSSLGPLSAATVGSYHNAFLDYAFPRMKKAIRKRGDDKHLCKAIAQAMREFVVANRIAADPRSIGDDIAGSHCPATRGKKASFSLADDGTPSPEFNAIAAEMEYAVESGQSVEQLSALFQQNVAYARANLPPVEADVIESAASVGLSSVEYWEANYVTQEQQLRAELEAQAYNRLPGYGMLQSNALTGTLLAPPASPRMWRAAARRVGWADLKGAIKGGISGIRGGVPGVLAGAAIEGGARSAGALIKELIQ